jgi:hypothetical protein
MKKCKDAANYTGQQPPRCEGGRPCQTCLAKWEKTLRQRSLDSRQTARGVKFETELV